MDTPQMQQLQRKRSSAKTKMILGIIFTAVALLLEIIGIILLCDHYTEEEGVIFVVLSLPFWGVGLPFMIIGIVKLIKSNRQISMIREEQK